MNVWVRGAAERAPARKGAAATVLAAALALSGLALAAPSRAATDPPEPAGSSPDTTAEGQVIQRVEILPRGVFSPVPGSRLGGLESLANRLHARTRTGTIRRQLLFKPGNKWSDERARETSRNLRALSYLDPLRVEGRRERDSVVAVVETRDLWTTTPRFDIASADGRQVGQIGLADRNLLGYGKSISLFYRDDTNGKSWNLSYDDPNLVGGRHRLRYGAGKGSEGATDQVAIGLPFYAEQSLRAYTADWSRSTYVTHLFASGTEMANFDERSEHVDLWYGGRLPDGTWIRRLIGVFELWDRRLGPSRLVPGAPPGFAGEEENIHIRRLAGELSLWHPNFIERTNIDRVTRTEDFDVGMQLGLKLGFAPRALGSTDDEGFVRLRLAAGAQNRFGFGWFDSYGSTRLAPESVERIAQLDSRWYVLPFPRHTLAFGAYGIAGANTPRDFQARVGGLNGLRAYPIEAVAGQRLWRLNAEERWLFSPDRWQFVKLGGAFFFDAARAWGAGAATTSWFRNAGLGVRVGIPSWGLSEVMRMDLAWPIEPTRDGGRKPIFTFGSSQAF